MKYKNTKVTIDGFTFDSKKEFRRYCELKALERAGVVKNLRRQVPYELIPTQKVAGRTERAVTYKADFVYEENGKEVVEDVKGFKTKEYILKRKMMLWRYGIVIKETY